MVKKKGKKKIKKRKEEKKVTFARATLLLNLELTKTYRTGAAGGFRSIRKLYIGAPALLGRKNIKMTMILSDDAVCTRLWWQRPERVIPRAVLTVSTDSRARVWRSRQPHVSIRPIAWMCSCRIREIDGFTKSTKPLSIRRIGKWSKNRKTVDSMKLAAPKNKREWSRKIGDTIIWNRAR